MRERGVELVGSTFTHEAHLGAAEPLAFLVLEVLVFGFSITLCFAQFNRNDPPVCGEECRDHCILVFPSLFLLKLEGIMSRKGR